MNRAKRNSVAEAGLRPARILALLALGLASACTNADKAKPSIMARQAPWIVDASLIGPSAVVNGTTPAAAPSASAAPAMQLPTPSIVQTPARIPDAPAAVGKIAPLIDGPARKLPAPVVVVAPAKIPDVPAVVGNIAPPLDVASLKARLRDTSAIGVFTKLALKNQVDDLLQQFRAHYLGTKTTGVSSLRQPYDMLVLKVLALIQDSDPQLARAISGSREAIWGMLADPEKFKTII